jgi:hypothetical protein
MPRFRRLPKNEFFPFFCTFRRLNPTKNLTQNLVFLKYRDIMKLAPLHSLFLPKKAIPVGV